MFTYFRAISLFILLSASAALGAVSEVDGPGDIFGGGGVSEGSDVTFSNMTVVGNLVVRQPGGILGTDELRVYHNGTNGYIQSEQGQLLLNTNSSRIWFQGQGKAGSRIGGDLGIANNAGLYFTKEDFAFYGTPDIGFKRYSSNILGVNNGSTGKGSLAVGGVFTAFRHISSATETLTGTDHTVFCLANDNEVVATMPPCSGQSYSQQLKVIYTDSGSTNRCKLDGNGAETVASFDVYSGLDTFEEGCHFVCDGSGNWWRAGCF